MKILLIVMALFVTGCSDDAFVFAEGYSEEVIQENHIQKCSFQKEMTIQWDTIAVDVMPGDTVAVQFANNIWYYIDDNGGWHFLDIDLGIEVDRDTVSRHFQHAEYEESDSVMINIHHEGVYEVF